MQKMNKLMMVPDSDTNGSGITPLEYKVLIKIPTDDGTITTASGFRLYKPDETKERDEAAAVEGVVVDMSPLAFRYETDAPRPAIGDRVLFQRYSGVTMDGADGEKYRIMNDKDIVGVRHV